MAGYLPREYQQAEELAKQRWNEQADQHNQWAELGQDEKDELIAAAMKESQQ